ncbi:MAG TPA: 6,7-dimethyl-8-ribityllumazine synthase [Pyrinomonadaceae bacterium]|nr:6,7-dimethyl-8-ribityllumazine synthase [Pyrinomonadaceae bacterium]
MKTYKNNRSAANLRVAIVAARWNDLFTSRLVDGAVETLISLGADPENIEILRVPGAFELPLVCRHAALSGRFDAVVALGVVIRGETPHFDYVAGEAARGIAEASRETGVPIAFGVVTANTTEQAADRCGLKAGNKGAEAAISAVETANLLRQAGFVKSDRDTSAKAVSNVV